MCSALIRDTGDVGVSKVQKEDGFTLLRLDGQAVARANGERARKRARKRAAAN